MKKEQNKRIIQLDLARTIAILCVVFCHATEYIYTLTKSGYDALSIKSGFFMVLAFNIGRLGVPIFLFLTGTLILSKKIEKDKDILSFYKNNFIPLLIVYLVWIFIYNFYYIITKQFDRTSLEYFIKELFLIKKVPFINMWYMNMIISIYIGLPFISKIVKTFSYKTIKYIIYANILCFFILPTINTFMQIEGIKENYDFLYNLSYFGGLYGTYILLGFYIYNSDLKKFSNKKLMIISLLSFAALIIFQIYSYNRGENNYYNTWYNSPFLLICSLCNFKMITRIKLKEINKKIKKTIEYISRASLAVFFIHIIVIDIMVKYIKNINLIMPIQVILLFVISFTLSLSIIKLLNKNKYISRFVLLIK